MLVQSSYNVYNDIEPEIYVHNKYIANCLFYAYCYIGNTSTAQDYIIDSCRTVQLYLNCIGFYSNHTLIGFQEECSRLVLIAPWFSCLLNMFSNKFWGLPIPSGFFLLRSYNTLMVYNITAFTVSNYVTSNGNWLHLY